MLANIVFAKSIAVLKSSVGKKSHCWTSQQWHPTSNQRRPWGATDLSKLRSVLDQADHSLFERDPV